MDIKTYQRIWGTARNQLSKRGYFPTPSTGFSTNSTFSPFAKSNPVVSRYTTNHELKEALLTAQD